ncbi:MAG: N-acetyltransferase family protein [Candidatus Thorarchaeota archaeon]
MTDSELVLRSATTDDIPTVAQLWAESALYHAEIESRFQYVEDIIRPTIEHFLNELQSEKCYIAVAQLGEDIIGYIKANIFEKAPIHIHRRMGFVDGLFVNPDVRRKGVGSGLWNKALDWMKQKSVSKAQLWVTSANAEAMEFWKKRGFKELNVQFELDMV